MLKESDFASNLLEFETHQELVEDDPYKKAAITVSTSATSLQLDTTAMEVNNPIIRFIKDINPKEKITRIIATDSSIGSDARNILKKGKKQAWADTRFGFYFFIFKTR